MKSLDRLGRAHFEHHFQRNPGIVTHALHRLLAPFERQAHRPRREIDLAGDQQVKRSSEINRSISEGHHDPMFFANAGDEIDFAALSPHAQ